MTSPYIAEAATICAMASAMQPLRSLDDRDAIRLQLRKAGFSADEISAFIERAIFSETMRRIVFSTPVERFAS